MKIAVIGTGYVGLVSGVCFSEFGFEVICIDKDEKKIQLLNDGGVPIYEPGLDKLLKKNMLASRLSFSSSMEDAVNKADIIFIAVGTPSKDDGSANLEYVYTAAEEISKYIRNDAVLVVKSTVPVGTTAEVRDIIRKNGKNTSVAFNPEFLKEGAAVEDFMHPDRVILGIENDYAKDILSHIYRPLYLFNTPIVFTNLESAELCKYASNAFLAMKVTFINEVADLCEKCNADINGVALAMGLDRRIGREFLQAGPGFGGSCFPKDTSALSDFAMKKFSTRMPLAEQTIKSNNLRKISMIDKVINSCGGDVLNKNITILGVTFKPNTDDVRESASIHMIPALTENGANITIYDPSKSEKILEFIKSNIKIAENVYEACNDADATVILTDWSEFRAINLKEILRRMNGKILIDLRNIYNLSEAKSIGFEYHSIGRS